MSENESRVEPKTCRDCRWYNDRTKTDRYTGGDVVIEQGECRNTSSLPFHMIKPGVACRGYEPKETGTCEPEVSDE